jgi:hypothetical protein
VHRYPGVIKAVDECPQPITRPPTQVEHGFLRHSVQTTVGSRIKLLLRFHPRLERICCKNSLTIQDVEASPSSSLLWNVVKIFFATDPAMVVDTLVVSLMNKGELSAGAVIENRNESGFGKA